MYILALETTGAHASVAVIGQEGSLVQKKSRGVLNHLQDLIPMTRALLAENGIDLGQITAIAASEGPGSFTGIRIGVSTARALAQVRHVPVIGVPTLKVFAYNMPKYGGLICPIFDARRSQVYGGAWRWQQGVIQEVVAGAPYSIEAFLEKVRAVETEHVMFFGDGTKVYKEALTFGQLAPEEVRLQQASSVAQLALEYYQCGKITDYNHLTPNYMRQAEAQRKLEEKRRKEQQQKEAQND